MKTSNLNLKEKILMGPGPSMVDPRVIEAMQQGMFGYLDPDFMTILDDLADKIRTVYDTKNTSMAIPGTGSAGMEAGLSSLLEPGEKVIMCVYGFFCERMVDMAERIGANVIPIRADWGAAFPAEQLEIELKKHSQVKLVTAIHGETSTGIEQDLKQISELTRSHDALFMVDAVTTLGGTQMEVDEMGIDYIYSASQKCIGAPPGLSPVALSEQALQSIRARKTKPSSWYLDLGLLADYWGEERIYHHTTPVSMIFALHKAYEILLEEGLENRYIRHKLNAGALIAGLSQLNIEVIPPIGSRLNQITPVWIPTDADDDIVRSKLVNDYSIEIGKGLGAFSGKVWRIGLMGESSRQEYVLKLLTALEQIFNDCGFEVPTGSAIEEANAYYQSEDLKSFSNKLVI
ncbi:alanine--glyoxylate aminotransferase family protein [Dehalococcoidia bacterium]|nr:alanine--glyoxylate aminotransferase family protein [Dehalococcoidia bacterium]